MGADPSISANNCERTDRPISLKKSTWSEGGEFNDPTPSGGKKRGSGYLLSRDFGAWGV